MSANTSRGSIAILGTGLAGMGHAGGATEQEIIAQAAREVAVFERTLHRDDEDGEVTFSLHMMILEEDLPPAPAAPPPAPKRAQTKR